MLQWVYEVSEQLMGYAGNTEKFIISVEVIGISN